MSPENSDGASQAASVPELTPEDLLRIQLAEAQGSLGGTLEDLRRVQARLEDSEEKNVELVQENRELSQQLFQTQVSLFIAELRLDGAIADNERDGLTNLFNKTTWNEKLDIAVGKAKETDSHVGLAFLDLDSFKQVNDTFGHSAGDELLVSFGAKLSLELRLDDSITGRFGGDEFGIFVPLVQRDDKKEHDPEYMAKGFQKRVREIIDEFVEEHPEITDEIPSFGISVGFISTLDGYETGADLLEAGDQMMYGMKRNKDSRSNKTQVTQKHTYYRFLDLLNE